MKNIISRSLLPGALLISVGSFLYARHIGANLELPILLSSLGALGLAMLLERYMPHQAAWNVPKGDRSTDWVSFGLLAGAVQPLLKWLSPLAVVALYGTTEPASSVFPDSTPFAVQVLLVTLLAEFGKYWVHRWHHTQPALWWLHALHHGSERLYSINNFRVHPLEYALKHSLSMLPLMLLGVPADVLLGYIALTQPVQMLQHVNLPLRHGWLNYVFSTNELHRWHHSSKPEEGNATTAARWSSGIRCLAPSTTRVEPQGLHPSGCSPPASTPHAGPTGHRCCRCSARPAAGYEHRSLARDLTVI